MDIAMIGLLLGLFSGAALVGVFAQTTGRSIQFKSSPPDKIGMLFISVSLIFIFGYISAKEDFFQWAWWQYIVFLASTTISSTSGYTIGYLAMQFMKRGDKD